MNEIKTILTCPLGHKCEEVKDNAIHRCAWYTKLVGKNPNTGAEMDEWGCNMHWMPVLLVENAGAIRSHAAATESFRNEVVQANAATQQLYAATLINKNTEKMVLGHNIVDQ